MFDMLEYGWLLAWDRDNGFAVTWNGSATYNLWSTQDNGVSWENIDVRVYDPTRGAEPVSLDEAADYARGFLSDVFA